MSEFVRLTRENDIGWLILDRPFARNALNREMWRAIPALLDEAAEDHAIKVLVVRGSGGCFAAGADIAEMEPFMTDAEEAGAYAAEMAASLDGLARFVKPALAMVEGACVGGGLALALACDLRFCAEGARLGVTPSRLGLVYPLGDTARLVRAAGVSAAKDLLFTGRLIDGEEAKAMGLVDWLLPLDKLDDAVRDYAKVIAAGSQYSIQGAKRMIGRVLAGKAMESAESRAEFARAAAGPDFREGRSAFLEKRTPKFPWK